MLYFVHILKSLSSKKSYVGVSNDITRRLTEHNSGKNFYTKRHLPWKIAHLEEFGNFKEAREREMWFKTTSGRRFLKKIFSDKDL